MQRDHRRESDEDAPTVRMAGHLMRQLRLDAATPPTAAPRAFEVSDDGCFDEASLEASFLPQPAAAAAAPEVEEGYGLEHFLLVGAVLTLAGLIVAGVLLLA